MARFSLEALEEKAGAATSLTSSTGHFPLLFPQVKQVKSIQSHNMSTGDVDLSCPTHQGTRPALEPPSSQLLPAAQLTGGPMSPGGPAGPGSP